MKRVDRDVLGWIYRPAFLLLNRARPVGKPVSTSPGRALFAVALILLTACKEQAPAADAAATDAEAWLQQELGWVEGADPAQWVKQDQAQRHYRFMSVCSLGCSIVGVGEVTVRMCHPTLPVDTVDKTTEAVQSERHAALKKQAKAFAETYNRLMAADLKAMGAGDCPPPVDWEQANTEITGMLDQVYSSGFRGDVYVHDQKRAFQIRLPRGVKVADVHKPLCDIIGRNGLKDLAALEVKSVDTTEDYAKLAC
ncbi:MAG: hypothetical protein AB7I36_07610 [Rhodospirillaceae bacterium]